MKQKLESTEGKLTYFSQTRSSTSPEKECNRPSSSSCSPFAQFKAAKFISNLPKLTKIMPVVAPDNGPSPQRASHVSKFTPDFTEVKQPNDELYNMLYGSTQDTSRLDQGEIFTTF